MFALIKDIGKTKSEMLILMQMMKRYTMRQLLADGTPCVPLSDPECCCVIEKRKSTNLDTEERKKMPGKPPHRAFDCDLYEENKVPNMQDPLRRSWVLYELLVTILHCEHEC